MSPEKTPRAGRGFGAMEMLRGQSVPGAPNKGWAAELTRVLEEHHLAAWSFAPGERAWFAAGLSSFLAGIDAAQVVTIYGRDVTDLEGLCYQLERSIPGSAPMRRRIDGPMGVVARLRSRDEVPGRPMVRTRYLVWHDPDAMIDADAGLFGRLADAIAGVSAESEYASDDSLLVTRAVYVGGEVLRAYAGLESGQLRSWLGDGSSEPFWRVVSGVESPPVVAGSVAELVEDPGRVADEMLLASVGALLV